MTPRHHAHAQSVRRFGRRPTPSFAQALDAFPQAAFSDELRLFALTFAGGFLFMTVYLA